MNVKDLIELLSRCDPSKEVKVANDGEGNQIKGIHTLKAEMTSIKGSHGVVHYTIYPQD